LSTLYENIKFHCDRIGISGAKLCADSGISKSTLTSLKNGRTKKINTENLAKMAGVLGVTIDELLGSEQKEKSPTPEGAELIPGYEDLSDENKAKARDFIAFLLSQQ
jgi:transcriptional regulator with XRE-family HTH domain